MNRNIFRDRVWNHPYSQIKVVRRKIDTQIYQSFLVSDWGDIVRKVGFGNDISPLLWSVNDTILFSEPFK